MEDSRKNPRCTIHWRSAIVVKDNGGEETIQCKTNDISISGVSLICHRNISPPQAVTVYLLIDPGSHNHPQVIVEAQGQIRNNVLSGQQGGFRLGIEFTKFAKDGKQVLTNHLPRDMAQSTRMVAPPPPPPVKAPPAPEAVPEVPAEAPAEAAAAADSPAPDGALPAAENPAAEDTTPPPDEAPAQA